MARKIKQTTNVVIDVFKKIDNFIYNVGDKIL